MMDFVHMAEYFAEGSDELSSRITTAISTDFQKDRWRKVMASKVPHVANACGMDAAFFILTGRNAGFRVCDKKTKEQRCEEGDVVGAAIWAAVSCVDVQSLPALYLSMADNMKKHTDLIVEVAKEGEPRTKVFADTMNVWHTRV